MNLFAFDAHLTTRSSGMQTKQNLQGFSSARTEQPGESQDLSSCYGKAHVLHQHRSRRSRQRIFQPEIARLKNWLPRGSFRLAARDDFLQLATHHHPDNLASTRRLGGHGSNMLTIPKYSHRIGYRNDFLHAM